MHRLAIRDAPDVDPVLEVVDVVSLGVEIEPPLDEETSDARCVVCDGASYGARCPCCDGDLCAEHDGVVHRWCARCEEDYAAQRGALEHALLAFSVLVAIGAVALVARAHAHDDPFLKGFSAATLLAGGALIVIAAYVRATGRARFRAMAGLLRDR